MDLAEAQDLAKLFSFLQEEDYYNLLVINGKVCGLHRFMFTTGLVVGLTFDSYERRYCYETERDAGAALILWDGVEHPDGPWIKLKGTYEGEYVDLLNPALTC